MSTTRELAHLDVINIFIIKHAYQNHLVESDRSWYCRQLYFMRKNSNLAIKSRDIPVFDRYVLYLRKCITLTSIIMHFHGRFWQTLIYHYSRASAEYTKARSFACVATVTLLIAFYILI